MLKRNFNLFGYVPKEDKGHVTPCSIEQLKEGFRSPDVLEICLRIAVAAGRANRREITREEFEDIKSREKRKLPAWTPMATWTGDRRKKEDAIANGLVMADLDHLTAPIRVYERNIRPLAEEGIVRLCHLTPSTADDRSTGGLRIVFRCPGGMDVEQAQAWLYDRLTDVPEECKDKCVKDLSRISFFVPAHYILYPTAGVDGLDEAFADIAPVAPADAPRPTATPVTEAAQAAQAKETEQTATAAAEKEFPTEFKGIAYTDIVDKLLGKLGGEPRRGERNIRLHRLACHLRAVTDADEELLMHIMPRCGLDEEEVRRIIHSACTGNGIYYLSREMKQVLDELDPTGEASALHEPPMPQKLPRLIRLLLQNTPREYRPVVANAAFPALAAYLNKVTFDYIDNHPMEAALMHLTIAPSGAGKSCVNDVIQHITARMRARDAVSRERDQEWKDQSATRSANERGKRRPTGLVIQHVQPDMTSAALIQRLHDAEGRFLFTHMDEIDSLDKLKDQKFTVIKNAFDCADWGAERVGKESVSRSCQIKYNWVASTTPGHARDYFRRALTDGALNRLNISTIPQREIGAPMPVYGRYTEQWVARLAPYIARLEEATGHVRCPQAEKLARAIAEELSDYAILTGDRTYEHLSWRANVIGYRKAMVLWLAGGQTWEKAIEDFVRWSVQYDLYCKYLLFGEAISRAEEEDNACIGRRGPVNMVKEMPHTFTYADVDPARARRGMPTGGRYAAEQVRKWRDRGYCVRGEQPGTWVKTEKGENLK